MQITTHKTRKTAEKAGVVFVVVAIVFLAGLARAVRAEATAVQVERLQNVSASGDFVVGPGKQEVSLKPGESKTVVLTVTNRTGATKKFEIGFEDVAGSKDGASAVTLLGDERGEYSLKSFLSVPEKSFFLEQGETATVPVTVKIPLDTEAGGKFGSVVVSTVSASPAASGNSATIVSRIGTLFFVTVEGKNVQEGRVLKFETIGKKTFFDKGPIDFQIVFQNTGNVHLNPYGEIDLEDVLGRRMEQIELDPWFVLPGSLRLREVSWKSVPSMGVYKVTAKINRGYGDVIDLKTTWVVVGAMKMVEILGAVIIVIGAAVMVRRKRKIKAYRTKDAREKEGK